MSEKKVKRMERKKERIRKIPPPNTTICSRVALYLHSL
jgi:hypothetical protein